MWSVPVLVGVAALAWAALVGLLLAEAPRPAWPVVLAGSAGLLVGGVAVAGWKYPSWEAVLLLVGVPAIAMAVTGGHPVRMLDPKWRMASDEVTEDAEAEADRYAFRAVLAVAVAVVVLMIVFGW
jgi:hypothetical protein